MWIDGIPVPAWVRPWVGWVLGTDWPKGDENALFRLADALLGAAKGVARGADGDGAGLLRGIGDSWDGAALRAFVARVQREVGGRRATLVSRLVGLAIACNDLGVQIQFTKRLMRLTVLLLVAQLVALSVALVTPAGRLALRLMKLRAQAARWTIKEFGRRLLLNIALFGGLMGSLDLLVQATQSRRDGVDWKQVGTSAGMGALTGGLMTGLAWAMPVRSLWTLMAHSAVANGGATLASELLDGRDGVDWELVLKGMTSGAVGGADGHWGTWSPGGGVKHLGNAAKAFGADLDMPPSTHPEPPLGGHPADGEVGGARRRPDADVFSHQADGEPVLAAHAPGDSAPVGRAPAARAGGEHVPHAVPGMDELVRARAGADAAHRAGADVAHAGQAAAGEHSRHTVLADAPEARPDPGGHAQAAEAPRARPDHSHTPPDQQAQVRAEQAPVRADQPPAAAGHRAVPDGQADAARPGGHDRPRPGTPDRGTVDAMINRAVPQDPQPAHQPTHQPAHQPAHQPTHQAAAASEQHTAGAPPHAADAPPPDASAAPASPAAARQGDGGPPAGPVRFEDSGTTFTGRRAEPPASSHHPGEHTQGARSDAPAEQTHADAPASPSGAEGKGPHPIVRAPGGTVVSPDTRRPLLPVHTAAELAQLRGVHANRIDPHRALRASEWAHLREHATAYRVEGRSGLCVDSRAPETEANARKKAALDRSADVTVRRIGVRTGGETRWVTEIAVKVRWVADAGVTHADVLRLQASAMDGVDLYFNHQHRLSDGSQLHVRLTFERADNARAGADDVVTFRAGDGRANQNTWYLGDPPHIHAHELGHHLGLVDEYHEVRIGERRTLTSGARGFAANLMGNASVPSWGSRELMVDHHGYGVPPLAGLLDHHLQRIEGLLHRAEADDRRADPPGHGKGPAVGEAGYRVRADEFSRSEYVADNLVMPSHILDLLHQFPHQDGDLLDHLWVLDHADWLFEGGVTTRDQIDYVRELHDSIRTIYGAAPADLKVKDVERVHQLVYYLGADSDGRSILEGVAAVLGDGEPVTPRVVEGLSRLVEWNSHALGTPRPDEIGPEAVHRAAAEFFAKPPSPELTRRAAELFATAAEHSVKLSDGRVDHVAIMLELRRSQNGPWWGRVVDGEDFARMVDRLYGLDGKPGGPTSSHAPDGRPHQFPPNHDLTPRERAVIAAMLDDWGAHPFALDPEEAVAASRSESQRAHADVVALRAADPREARVEQRRFEGYDAAGELRHITEYTVRLRVASSELSPQEIRAFNARLQEGLDRYVNGRHRTADGDQLHVRVRLEVAVGPTRATIAHGDHSMTRGPLDFRAEAPTLHLVQQVVRQLGMEPVRAPTWLDPAWADRSDLVRHDEETDPAGGRDGAPSETRTPATDAGARSPLVAAGEVREVLRQDHAYALDPRKTVSERSIAAARKYVEAHVITRDEAHTVEARRMQARAADGTLQRVTEFTLTLRYGVSKDLSPEALLKIFSDVRDAVDLHFNHQHRLPVDGSQLHVRVRFERAPAGAERGERVELTRRLPDNWKLRVERPVLAELAPLNLHAQKIGQLLGLEMESLDPRMRKTTRVLDLERPARDGSVMGPAVVQWATRPDRGWAGVHDLQRLAVPEVSGLRDRHLWTLNEHLIREDVPEPMVPLRRVPAGEPVVPTPWSRTDPERGVVPNHIRILLKRFPVEGSWLEHVRLLDRVVALFGGNRVDDRLTFNQITHEHLRYVRALGDLAAEVYGAQRDHSFNAEELIRLHGLTVWLGRGPYEALPDGGWLRDAVNDLLGRPADRPLTEKDVHFLGGLASRHDRTPLGTREERSPAALLERARRELDQAPLTVRAALDASATPLEREAARWGDRAEDVVAAAPHELPPGETLRDVLRSGTADPDALEAWLRRVAEVEYPGAGVRAELGEWSLDGGRLTYSLYFRSVDGPGSRGLPLAMAQYTLLETSDGRLVAVHYAPSLAPYARPVDAQRVKMAWTRGSKMLDDAYIAAGVAEIRYPGYHVLRLITPP
ncbi:WXG100-like domain-containing protein [Nonomuraea rhodomycinica]|uniref:Outer membrane channel protein CpnT-like N-terminal domain-containing protein n=1 Tax=Nonomuraea rhodomycinica TaxID=1712872 RepID=A0A7Y6MA62_9ACTN|nr:hypothetical protein [Nonomuraea rhodomycinica]NUW40953.1 hypothetical protein [Nonomuraea rhodomycinica]